MANEISFPELDKMDQTFPTWWMLILPFTRVAFWHCSYFQLLGIGAGWKVGSMWGHLPCHLYLLLD